MVGIQDKMGVMQVQIRSLPCAPLARPTPCATLFGGWPCPVFLLESFLLLP